MTSAWTGPGENLRGRAFGEWVVEDPAPSDDRGVRVWVRCACGRRGVRHVADLARDAAPPCRACAPAGDGEDEPLEFHPVAAVFPMMDDERFAELVKDIRARGLLTPIQLYEEKILDGRNRYRACLEADVEPTFVEVTDCNPYDRVWSLNGARRDLTDAQRYLCWKATEEGSAAWQAKRTEIAAAGIEKQRRSARERPRTPDGRHFAGGRGRAPRRAGPGQLAKAEAAHVGRGTVWQMDTLARHRPDLAEKVRIGELSPAAARAELKAGEPQSTTGTFREDEIRAFEELLEILEADGQVLRDDAVELLRSDAMQAVRRKFAVMRRRIEGPLSPGGRG